MPPTAESLLLTLHLDFDTDMPLYEQIAATRSEGAAFDMRYIVTIYDASKGGELVDRVVFTKSAEEWNNTVQLELMQGLYDIVVWADFVDAGTIADKYYCTSNFENIANLGELSGSNDYRDTFVGDATLDLTAQSEAYAHTIEMGRPMAKYRFIATDVEAFIEQIGSMNDANVDLNDYYVVFYYPGYVNTSFDALSDMPAESQRNQSFRSNIERISDTEAELGFDYVFVGGDTKVWVSLEIYDKNGTNIGGVDKLLVPLSRSKLTEIREAFLTSKEAGGVGLNPDFDDEITIPIG